MFMNIKNAALIATVIHSSGVLGHGFVRKITIDGVEYVFHFISFFRIQNSLFLFPCSYPGANPLVNHPPVSSPLIAYGQSDSRQDLRPLFGPTLVVTGP